MIKETILRTAACLVIALVIYVFLFQKSVASDGEKTMAPQPDQITENFNPDDPPVTGEPLESVEIPVSDRAPEEPDRITENFDPDDVYTGAEYPDIKAE